MVTDAQCAPTGIGSCANAPKRPTVLAFDLDPGPPADIVDCCRVALRLRDLFGHFDVRSFPKTSGSKGMQVYVPLEGPRGELGAHVVSDGGTRPYRVHLRDPSFINLQAVAAMAIGGQIADVIASVASIDPVMGGCDR